MNTCRFAHYPAGVHSLKLRINTTMQPLLQNLQIYDLDWLQTFVNNQSYCHFHYGLITTNISQECQKLHLHFHIAQYQCIFITVYISIFKIFSISFLFLILKLKKTNLENKVIIIFVVGQQKSTVAVGLLFQLKN